MSEASGEHQGLFGTERQDHRESGPSTRPSDYWDLCPTTGETTVAVHYPFQPVITYMPFNVSSTIMSPHLYSMNIELEAFLKLIIG